MSNFKLTLVRKAIRLHRIIKHFLFSFFNYKISNYQEPPKKITEIGFFDNNSKIHISGNYHKLIDKDNIYSSGDFRIIKNNTISIVEVDGELLIKKKYSGLFKFDIFYNEIICLDKLKDIKQTPNIKYIDYKNNTIFINYIDGVNFSDANLTKLPIQIISSLTEFKKSINIIHRHKIAIVDVRGQNMIMKDSVYYIIDFADSIYFSDNATFKCCNYIFDYFAFLDVKRFEYRFNKFL